MPTTNLHIEGMTCGGCAKSIENALKRNPKVTTVAVDFPSKTAQVDGDAAPAELIAQIKRLGFEAHT